MQLSKEELAAMYCEKRDVIYAIRAALKIDVNASGVLDMEYVHDEERNLEFIDIVFTDGSISRINVTINSHEANIKEIIREVYGDGAIGKVRDYKAERK